MNRLSFGSFHAAHFSPQHTQQWQSYLQQLHSHTYEHYYPPQEPGHYTHEELRRTDQDLDNNSGDDDDDDLPLSKEAIEIFEFSEAFSKEQQQDTDSDGEKDQHDINTIMNVATELYYDGIEAPVTSLVLLSSSPLTVKSTSTPPDSSSDTSSRILTQQHLLNSAYLSSCDLHYQEQVPLVMWPVLPFRL